MFLVAFVVHRRRRREEADLMRGSHLHRFVPGIAAVVVMGVLAVTPWDVATQGAEPQMFDRRLAVSAVVSDLVTPTTMAFLGPDEFFILEKNTGRVQHVVAGEVLATVLDLAVNFASERGLLGIALHPDFPDNPGVYLFWTCKSLSPPADPANHFIPDQRECADANMLESATNKDTEDVLEVPLLGNRVDRFEWTGSALTFDHRLTDLLALQNDAAPTPAGQGDEDQPARGNHDGGVITFGRDGKLYVLLGDVGRRGQLQNLPSGPTATGLGPTVPDDQLGGPEPDDAHFTDVIIRLNPDGSAPTDNPSLVLARRSAAKLVLIFRRPSRMEFATALG